MHKKYFSLLSFLFFSCGLVYGQLSVDISSDRKGYIVYEPVKITVKIRNQSGSTLRFGSTGQDSGRLFFIVSDEKGNDVKARIKGANPANGLVIPKGLTKQVTVTLNNLFDLSETGHYRIKAQVEHSRLAQGFRSKAQLIEIKHGVLVKKERFGVLNKSGMSETRTVSFITIKEDREQMLCMKIEDSKIVYTFQRLAEMATGFEPRVEIDARNEIHVLLQTASRNFTYWRFNENGLEKERSSFPVVGQSVPLLVRDPDIGRVMVIGNKAGDESKSNPMSGEIPLYNPEKRD